MAVSRSMSIGTASTMSIGRPMIITHTTAMAVAMAVAIYKTIFVHLHFRLKTSIQLLQLTVILVGGNQTLKMFTDIFDVIELDKLVETCNPILELLQRVPAHAVRLEDLCMIRLLNSLFCIQKLLKKLLTGSQSIINDRDVHIRLQTVQTDQLPGHIDNPDRFTHVQNEHFTPFTHGSGLDHQKHSFGNRHEVPGHPGISDRNRPPFIDLIDEQWYDRSSRSRSEERRVGNDRSSQMMCRSPNAPASNYTPSV